jgi:hypothetical protein
MIQVVNDKSSYPAEQQLALRDYLQVLGTVAKGFTYID